MRRSKFNPNSQRSIRGLAFQADVERELKEFIPSSCNSRSWLLQHDSCLTEVQLNVLEHTWGDIVLIDNRLKYNFFVECISLGADNSIFPEHKIKKFQGDNKYYCFGWGGEKRFVHSAVWNSYARKCPAIPNYRKITRKNIITLRNQFDCVASFCDKIIKTNSCNTQNNVI